MIADDKIKITIEQEDSIMSVEFDRDSNIYEFGKRLRAILRWISFDDHIIDKVMATDSQLFEERGLDEV